MPNISNTELLFLLDNIFQQKFNMTTPNNFPNRYSQFQYPLSINPYTLPSPYAFSFNNTMRFTSYPQHFNFFNMLTPPNYYNLSQLSSLNSTPAPSALQPTQQPLPQLVEDTTIRGNNKI
jgi:hypothetical protein